MLVAYRLAGLSALRGTMQAPTRFRNKSMRKGTARPRLGPPDRLRGAPVRALATVQP
jgi:hypothetical protein